MSKASKSTARLRRYLAVVAGLATFIYGAEVFASGGYANWRAWVPLVVLALVFVVGGLLMREQDRRR